MLKPSEKEETCTNYQCKCGNRAITDKDREFLEKFNRFLASIGKRPLGGPSCKEHVMEVGQEDIRLFIHKTTGKKFKPALRDRLCSRTEARNLLVLRETYQVDMIVEARLLKIPLNGGSVSSKQYKVTAVSLRLLAAMIADNNPVLVERLDPVIYGKLMEKRTSISKKLQKGDFD